MNSTNPKVDQFLSKLDKWHDEMQKLRDIVLDCGLKEDFKWGQPCYTHNNGNVLIIHGFKAYCALLFFKGVLMKDPKGILIQQTRNVQAGRQIRFPSINEIVEMEPVLKEYIREAIEVEKSGKKVTKKKTEEYPVPEEFQSKLDEDSALKDAFESLTPGRQRAYLYYFSSAKLSKTREERIGKHIPRIMEGKGLND